MANYQALVTTAWTADATSNRPAFHDDYPSASWSDVTGQPVENIVPAPNLCNIVIECDLTTLNTIEADVNYLVIWSEEIVEPT